MPECLSVPFVIAGWVGAPYLHLHLLLPSRLSPSIVRCAFAELFEIGSIRSAWYVWVGWGDGDWSVRDGIGWDGIG